MAASGLTTATQHHVTGWATAAALLLPAELLLLLLFTMIGKPHASMTLLLPLLHLAAG
jgi:hypothetical protein